VATGVVVGAEVVSDATVLLPDGERREVETDFDGSFRIEQLPDGPVRIQARPRGNWDRKWSSGSSPWTTVRSSDPDVVLEVEPDDGWDWARLSVTGPDGTRRRR
jgi:hypothetical protein